MALVVEDGTGLANAESYVSIPASPSPTAQKEAYLRKATEYLDNRYGDAYQGARVTTTQALGWPRAYAVVDGVEVAEDALPTQLIRATCEVALLLAQGVDITPVLERGGRIKALTQVVGPLSERTAWADDASPYATFTAVDRWIKPLLDYGTGINGMVVRG